MLLKFINREIEQEKDRVKLGLEKILQTEIDSIKSSMNYMPSHKQEQIDELHRLMSSLLVRKSLIEFEAEQIVKMRTDMRVSVLALILSSVSLAVAVVTLLIRH